MTHRATQALAQAGYSTNNASALTALIEFAAQNPGLDRRNYYDPTDPQDNPAGYNAEARSIGRDWQRVKAALKEAAALNVTDTDIIEASKRAFSGRLTWESCPMVKDLPGDTYFNIGFCPFIIETDRKITRLTDGQYVTGLFQPEQRVFTLTREQAIELRKDDSKGRQYQPFQPRWTYCTGQYFPTEYRKAAASVLEAAINEKRRSNPQLPTVAPAKPTLKAMKEISKAAGFHFFDRDSMKFFDSRMHGQPRSINGLWYFITSEQFHGSEGRSEPRKYTIRAFNPTTGDTHTPEENKETMEFQKYRSLTDARAAMRQISNPKPYQPKTGNPCTCRKGQQRDNCPTCEGTGMVVDFAAIRQRTTRPQEGEAKQ